MAALVNVFDETALAAYNTTGASEYSTSFGGTVYPRSVRVAPDGSTYCIYRAPDGLDVGFMRLARFNADGTEAWDVEVEAPASVTLFAGSNGSFDSAVAFDASSNIYFGSWGRYTTPTGTDQYLVAQSFDTTGALRWREEYLVGQYDFYAGVDPNAHYANDRLYFHSGDSMIRVNPASGAELYRSDVFGAEDEVVTGGMKPWVSVVVGNDIVVTGDSGTNGDGDMVSTVFVVDDSGAAFSIASRFTVATFTPGGSLGSNRDQVLSMAAVGSVVYCSGIRFRDTGSGTTYSPWLYAANVSTGTVVWSSTDAYNASEEWFESVAVNADFVFVGGFSFVRDMAYFRYDVGDGAVNTPATSPTAGVGRSRVAAFEVSAEPAAVAANAGDRLRSSVTESTGSLLEAVDVRAVDANVSEAYTYAQRLDASVLTNYREVLRARDSATVDVAYYPRPRQNVVMENQYSGVTLLSRLSTYFPQRILDTVDADGLNIVTSGAATAQQIISYVLGVWAADTGWLTYETVPDLRVRMPGLNSPSDYDTVDVPRIGVARSSVVAIPQDGSERKDALTILKDLLSPFPGTVVRQNSTGKLQIVPAYGPDADATPFLTLDTNDLYSVSIGEPDPFGIVNRATFTSRGYEITDETETMQPAWFQIGSLVQFGRANWYTPPVNRVNLQPFEHDTAATLQETLSPSSSFTEQTPGLWPVSTSTLPAGDGISLLDATSTPMVTIAWARYFNDSLVSSGTNGLTITTPTIPFTGEWVTAFSVAFTTGGESVSATIRARWNASRQGVEFQLGTPMKLETDCFTGCNGVIIEFTLNDSSVGYVETASRTATFGIVDNPAAPTADDDSLPATDGGNAVAQSQVEYGVLERTVNINGYVFSGATLAEMARGFVIQNITPKVVRELDVSALSGYRVTFDTIGRLVSLPSGDEGRVTGVTYSDDFIANAIRKTATVEVPNPLGAGFIPTDTTYVLTESGAYWLEEETGSPVQGEG